MPNKDILDDIRRYIEEGEMSFLIGAGFSRNVNKDAYPLWGKLLEDAAWNLFGDGSKGNKAKKPPYLKSIDNKHVLMINGKATQDTVSPKCHLLLKNLDIQNIYTFNYDNALEYFMGEEAKKELENEISKVEDSLEALKKNKLGLLENRERLRELIESKSKNKENQSSDEVSELDNENPTDDDKIDKELKDTDKKIEDNRAKIQDTQTNLDVMKQSLKSFYNVVKDSYDISLSAKRKSIYKIHGSLREKEADDYGFDGDTHFYIYLKKDLDLVRHSVENGCGKDAPGNLAHYMVEHTTMHAWPMSAGRFDIGSLDTYYEAVEKYGK